MIVFSFLADFLEILIKNIDIFLQFYFTYCNLGIIIALVTHSQIIYHFKSHYIISVLCIFLYVSIFSIY